jgi:hypothetical protein
VIFQKKLAVEFFFLLAAIEPCQAADATGYDRQPKTVGSAGGGISRPHRVLAKILAIR